MIKPSLPADAHSLESRVPPGDHAPRALRKADRLARLSVRHRIARRIELLPSVSQPCSSRRDTSAERRARRCPGRRRSRAARTHVTGFPSTCGIGAGYSGARCTHAPSSDAPRADERSICESSFEHQFGEVGKRIRSRRPPAQPRSRDARTHVRRELIDHLSHRDVGRPVAHRENGPARLQPLDDRPLPDRRRERRRRIERQIASVSVEAKHGRRADQRHRCPASRQAARSPVGIRRSRARARRPRSASDQRVSGAAAPHVLDTHARAPRFHSTMDGSRPDAHRRPTRAE